MIELKKMPLIPLGLLAFAIAVSCFGPLNAAAAEALPLQSRLDQRIRELIQARQANDQALNQLSNSNSRARLVDAKLTSLQNQRNTEQRNAKWAALRALFGVSIGALSVIALKNQMKTDTRFFALASTPHAGQLAPNAHPFNLSQSLPDTVQHYLPSALGCLASAATIVANSVQGLIHSLRKCRLSAEIKRLEQFKNHNPANPYQLTQQATSLSFNAPDWNTHRTNHMVYMLLKRTRKDINTPDTVEQLVQEVNTALGTPWNAIDLERFRQAALDNSDNPDYQLLRQGLQHNQQRRQQAIQEDQAAHARPEVDEAHSVPYEHAQELPDPSEADPQEEHDAQDDILALFEMLSIPRTEQTEPTDAQSEQVFSLFLDIANTHAEAPEHHSFAKAVPSASCPQPGRQNSFCQEEQELLEAFLRRRRSQ